MNYRIRTRRGSVNVHASGRKPVFYGETGCQRVIEEQPDALDRILEKIDARLGHTDAVIASSIYNQETCIDNTAN